MGESFAQKLQKETLKAQREFKKIKGDEDSSFDGDADESKVDLSGHDSDE